MASFYLQGKTPKELGKQVAIATDCITLPAFLTANQIIHLSVSTLGCPWPNAIISGFNFSKFLNTRFDALSSGNQKSAS